MFKAKNIMIILILNYLCILIFCTFSEFLFINNKAQNLQLLIRTAADMAIEQIQVTDDFFLPGEGFMLNSNTSEYRIKAPYVGGISYKEVSVFKALTGKDNKKDIYMYIYGNGKMSKFINETNVEDIKVSGGYWNGTNLQWYKVPKIAQMGDEVIGDKGYPYNFKRAYDINKTIANYSVTDSIWKMYELNKSEKQGYNQTTNSMENYYYTPIKLGITYIEEELLQYFFMNNMDLLMRSKYVKSGVDLSTKEGGNGLLKGNTYANFIDESKIKNSNPINNGDFTLLRGNEKQDPETNALFYEGVKPTVRYKVIDMYNNSPENEQLLSLLFGVYPNENGSKAEYYKLLDKDVIDPATNQPYKSKPIVVAEVTFYADVIIPYTTIPLREMRAKESEDNSLQTVYLKQDNVVKVQEGNLIDVVREGTVLSTGIKSTLGNNSDVMVYRKLFAIAP